MYAGIEDPYTMLFASLVINAAIILFCLYKNYSLEYTLTILIITAIMLGIYSILAFVFAAFIAWFYYMIGKGLLIGLKNWWYGTSDNNK